MSSPQALPEITSPVRTTQASSPLLSANAVTASTASASTSMTESQKSWATRLFQETWEAKTRTMERRGFASPKAVSWARERQKQRRAAGGSGNHFAMALEPVVKNPLDRGMVVDAELSA